MVKGMATCKVCGRDFPLIAEEHYVARNVEKTGIIPAISGQEEATQYDAFDCPHCGCQNVMQERKVTCPCDYGICDECDHPGEETEDHDGCFGCLYEDVEMGEYPCNECMSGYTDKWERKGESEK